LITTRSGKGNFITFESLNQQTTAMKKSLIVFLFIFSLFGFTHGQKQDYIVFTAYQGFFSRIYVLNMDGSVHTFHEYENYRWQDMTVIDNEVYVAEAFMPGIYKVDIFTGDLTLIMHDFWLYYFYGLAWDGTYFYVKEWSMNRYDINGVNHGSASFSGTVLGATFHDDYYWMLGNENVIKCYDFSSWPTLVEVPGNNFTPPSSHCRGLWHDGEYFWTAESIESQLGKIYKFDLQGQVVQEWWAPAFRGWGAVTVSYGPVMLPGDANCDGVVDVLDVITIVNYIMGLNPEPFCFENADVNQDNTINLLDVIEVINIISGKRFAF